MGTFLEDRLALNNEITRRVFVGTVSLYTLRLAPAVSASPVVRLAWDAQSLAVCCPGLSFEHWSFHVFSQPQSTHACTISQSINSIMIRLLAAVLSPNNPFFHSVLTDWRIQILSRAGILLAMPPPKHIPFWEGPAPEEGTPRVSRELRGARAPRTRRQNSPDSAPPHGEHPPDEPAEFRLPALSWRSDNSYRAPEWVTNREGGR